jgi:hypothetical protein
MRRTSSSRKLNQGADALDAVIAATARASGVRDVDVCGSFAGYGPPRQGLVDQRTEVGLANGTYDPTAVGRDSALASILGNTVSGKLFGASSRLAALRLADALA